MKKCAFTGHRPQSLPFGFNESDERCVALKKTIRDEIIKQSIGVILGTLIGAIFALILQ